MAEGRSSPSRSSTKQCAMSECLDRTRQATFGRWSQVEFPHYEGPLCSYSYAVHCHRALLRSRPSTERDEREEVELLLFPAFPSRLPPGIASIARCEYDKSSCAFNATSTSLASSSLIVRFPRRRSILFSVSPPSPPPKSCVPIEDALGQTTKRCERLGKLGCSLPRVRVVKMRAPLPL